MIDPISAAWLAVAGVTLLGDPLVVVSIGIAAYLFGGRLRSGGRDRTREAMLLGLIAGALALTAALKTGLAITRPGGASTLPGSEGMGPVVESIYTWVVGPGGYAFPSGHATGAAVGWGGLAWVFADDDRRPLLVAGGAIVAIAASRVALGVHRPLEVSVGIGLGLTYLAVATRVAGTPRRTFALAGVIGTTSPLFVALDTDGLFAAGFALGGFVGWELLGAGRPSYRTSAIAIGGGLAVIGLFALRLELSQVALTLLAAGGGVAVVAAPLAVGNDRKNE
ncbi:phosphatase PAP2 family protein [Halorhabdus sp. CUG00001]|uniref:phosphatase PAP2 family protein n=1 Tax=Halorhabdus sp. CUG00001 TaxID=2600297 RepID=UPI00131A7E79|nr:phosphatase PAP2 family protein [Halorhabdus sp. CUG00001]